MVRNRENNDIDFFPYTQHPKRASQKSQNPPPEPWPLQTLRDAAEQLTAFICAHGPQFIGRK